MVKNFAAIHISWTEMLIYAATVSSVVSILAVIGTYIYFKKQLNSLHLIPQKK